jgi:hypothetical protein
MRLEISDLDVMKESALKKFDERLAKADPARPQDVEREAARLESQLEQLYSLTALMAQREPDVNKTAELWLRLMKICDAFANRVFQLSERHAASKSAYDTILDLRSAADELRTLHSE